MTGSSDAMVASAQSAAVEAGGGVEVVEFAVADGESFDDLDKKVTNESATDLNVYRNVSGTVDRLEHGVNNTCFGGRAGSSLPHLLLAGILLFAAANQVVVAAEQDADNPTKSGWVTPKAIQGHGAASAVVRIPGANRSDG